MRLFKYLDEALISKDIEDDKKIISLINKNCSDILSVYKSSDTRLYRRNT